MIFLLCRLKRLMKQDLGVSILVEGHVHRVVDLTKPSEGVSDPQWTGYIEVPPCPDGVLILERGERQDVL